MTLSTPRSLRRGSNAVEFALIAPLLIAMLMGTIEYGWFFFQQQGVMTAARHGVRTGAAMPLTEDASAVAISETEMALESQGIDSGTATVDAAFVGEAPFQVIELTVSVPYPGLTGFPTVVIPSQISTTLTMRMEYQPE